MPVHLYGMSCNMNEVTTFAERHNLAVIEDAAQGIGVTYNGKPVGGLGTIGCFSFFADKTITTAPPPLRKNFSTFETRDGWTGGRLCIRPSGLISG